MNNGKFTTYLMKKHIQIVAALHIALGALSLLAAIVVFVVFAMAGGIVISQGERQAAGILGIIAFAVCTFLAVLALLAYRWLGAVLGALVGAGPLVLVLWFPSSPQHSVRHGSRHLHDLGIATRVSGAKRINKSPIA